MKKTLLILSILFISFQTIIPNELVAQIGVIKIWAGRNLPSNRWARCEGQLLAIGTYNTLYSRIDTMYGGDGRTTFALPDLRGRIPVGIGRGPGLTQVTQGQRWGQEIVYLTISNLPSHNHFSLYDTVTVDNGSDVTVYSNGNYSNQTSNTGGNQPIPNIQPSLGVAYIIRIK